MIFQSFDRFRCVAISVGMTLFCKYVVGTDLPPQR